MFKLPLPQGYEEDVRFTLFNPEFITSKETYDQITESDDNGEWGCNYDEFESTLSFNRDLAIRGHIEGDDRFTRQRLYLLGIDNYNYLECLYHIVNRGRVYCPPEIQQLVDLGITYSIIYSMEFF